MKIKRPYSFQRSLVIFFFVVPLLSARAAFLELPSGARSASLAGAYVAASARSDALFFNPAGIRRPSGSDVQLFYTRLFGLAELHRMTLSAGRALGPVTLALAVARLDRSPYCEEEYIAGLSLPLSASVHLGAALRRVGLRILGYGSANATVFDAGGQICCGERMTLGWCWKNATRAGLGRCGEPLPGSFRGGLRIVPARDIRFFFDMVQGPGDCRFGTEVKAAANLYLRFGAAHDPARITAGLSLNLGRMQCDYAFDSHPDLDTTHLFAIRFVL